MTKAFEIDENYIAYIDKFKNKLLDSNLIKIKTEDIETIELKTVINSYISNLIRK
jgi:hypothetical protein